MDQESPLRPVPISDKGTRRYPEVAPRPPDGRIPLMEVFQDLAESDGLEIDIGFGRGASLFNRVRVAPNTRLIGIEIKHKWAYKVEQRRLRQKLSNLRSWAGDAREILERCEPRQSVTRFYVHFPDPWWKRKHQHRLVVADRFLASVAWLLQEHGEIYIQTDVRDRAEEYAAAVTEHEAFDAPVWLEENVYGAISGREQKAIEDGLPVYRFVARRNSVAVERPKATHQEHDPQASKPPSAGGHASNGEDDAKESRTDQ